MSADQVWWQVRFAVPAEMAEAVAWVLAEEFDLAVEVRDETTMSKASEPVKLDEGEAPLAERVAGAGAGGAGDEAGQSVVVIGLPAAPPADLDATITHCLARLGLGRAQVQTRRRTDNTWREGWKAFFRGARLSPRIAVHPPWEKSPADVPAAVVIDPGMAFGTGTHETTRGVIRVLDAVLAETGPTTVLDVGCGSGILAIAAALLGHRVVGVEIDPVALDNARENLERNGVGEQVELVEGSADSVVGRFGVVVANILAVVLIQIAPEIAARCLPGGVLVLSGMLANQVEAVQAAYRKFELVERSEEGDWVILRLRAPS